MNRLQSELLRLYASQAPAGADPEKSGLIDASGQVRAMVLELARPSDWAALSAVWQGVQVDLGLPAPAIAVNGTDGYQLWFSLAEPVPAPQAMVFLEALRVRYLGDIQTARVGMMPAVDASSPGHVVHARPVPALQADGGHWSAFVAPDLAPVFADEPWLDIPPGAEGQSDLLSRIDSMQLVDFQRALERLRPAVTTSAASPPASVVAAKAGKCLDPKRFLLDVMNDESIAPGLRIEAAKALLPYFDDSDRL